MLKYRFIFHAFVVAIALGGMSSFMNIEKGRAPASVDPSSGDLVSLGRLVYVSEGCIHCHSQYVRPVGPDQELWGPPTDPERALGQHPVLIGNRRQGPDLANVALRRNSGWNRLHLINPRAITPGSRMPAYPHLFEPDASRGEALLAYLASLH